MNEHKVRQYETATKISIDNFNKAYRDKNNICGKRGRDFAVVGENGVKYELKRKSLRYQVFEKNIKCVDCGITGAYYLIQKNIDKNDGYNVNNKYHANLYGINEAGEEVLMTKDHIVRKREGGKDHVDNLQTMCCICNCVIKN